MIKNYFKIAWRNTVRNKTYAIINISGLAIAMAVFIVTLLYVNHETGYDKWDKKLERVYRLGITKEQDGEMNSFFWSPYALGNQMTGSCPEVESVSRIAEMGEQTITFGNNKFYEKQIISADSSFFRVFPYKFLKGTALTALDQPGVAVITSEMSRKIFGNADPIGKTIDIASAYQPKRSFQVKGVVEKTGDSHLNFNICISSFNKQPGNWGRQIFTTYVLLKPGAAVAPLEKKTRDLYIAGNAAYAYSSLSANNQEVPLPGNDPELWLKINENISHIGVFLEAAADIHLHPKAGGWRDAPANHPILDSQKGNNTPVMVFSIAALLVLILACINYTNLSIARAGKRAKESGLRKLMGADRRQLITQFLAEAFLQSIAALLLGLVFAVWMTHWVNSAFGMHLSYWNEITQQQNVRFIGQLALIIFAVTICSGAYPAFILSSFLPAKVLKGDISKNIKGRLLRNGLVVMQFTISTCFLIGLLVVYLQLRHMRTNDPGFATEQVLVLNPANSNLISPQEEEQKWGLIKNQLAAIPGVTKVTAADSYPGTPTVNVQQATFNGKSSEMSFEYIHFDYFDVLNMPIVAGRNFSPAYGTDSINAAVINETAYRGMQQKDVIGQQVNILARDYTIIGILKDNRTAGYTTGIPPTIYAIGAKSGLLGGYRSALVKIDARNAASTLKHITDYWKTIEPEFPLRYAWLDHEFGKLLASYQQFGKITGILAIVSLFIALMGIFALSAFMAAQRTREIGIRKVFGASVSNVTNLLSKEFLKMVLIAVIIASPVAYWLMNKWLEDFAFRIQISWWIFLVTGIIMIAVALLVVSFQTVKAATANPIKSLRTD